MPAPRRSSFVPAPAPDLDPAHDPGFAAAEERGDRARATIPEAQLGHPLSVNGGGEIRVGTASWTDPTTLRSGFYPRGTSTAEERLRFYASQFPVVEVDATYYALPERSTAKLWVERTPADFTFHVKAHALMTGQPTEVARLPRALIDELPSSVAKKKRIYAKDLPPALLDEVWGYFLDALEPLYDAGKLGGILLQFPRWFLPTPESKDILAECAMRLSNVPAAVEFRNHLWYATSHGNRDAARWTADMLRELGLSYVMVDGPQGLPSSVPPMVEVTNPRLAVVRLHGRRTATWEAEDVATVERYRYLYDGEELEEWVPRIAEASQGAERTVVLLNNCYGNYGTTNARELVSRLTAAMQPVG